MPAALPAGELRVVLLTDVDSSLESGTFVTTLERVLNGTSYYLRVPRAKQDVPFWKWCLA